MDDIENWNATSARLEAADPVASFTDARKCKTNLSI
jgi:hypothetical protein